MKYSLLENVIVILFLSYVALLFKQLRVSLAFVFLSPLLKALCLCVVSILFTSYCVLFAGCFLVNPFLFVFPVCC